LLSRDEARRIAANIGRLLELRWRLDIDVCRPENRAVTDG
jgi:hypothetical protein